MRPDGVVASVAVAVDVASCFRAADLAACFYCQNPCGDSNVESRPHIARRPLCFGRLPKLKLVLTSFCFLLCCFE